MKISVIKYLNAMLIGLVSINLYFGFSPAMATLVTAEISEPIPEKLYAKLGYIFSEFDEPPALEDLQYLNFAKVSIIRINSPKYCESDACLGFVILECDLPTCPYASAPFGNKLTHMPNYGHKPILGASYDFAVSHDQYELGDGPQAVFNIGPGFVTALYVKIKKYQSDACQ